MFLVSESYMPSESQDVILVVDDDPVQRMLLVTALEKSGFVSIESDNGEDGLRKCLDLRPDVLILDVMMPGRDGFDVCEEVRKSASLKNLPVLLITGLDDVASIERAFEVGATNFLTKPLNLKTVGHYVKYMLRSSKMEQQVTSARRLAEEASAAKSQFLANMSHELRTPLNAIIGFSEIISTQTLGPVGNLKYIEYTKDIYTSATHLIGIINDILDISKIESGDFLLNLQACNLSDICQRVLRLLTSHAMRSEVSIIQDIDVQIPEIISDELRLKQILLNILSNAVKFTPPGGLVTFRASLSVNQGLYISISDTGIGIPENQIDKALSLFGQIDADLNRKFQGIGLGLPLAKMMTERLGGSLDLTSIEGRGTTVTLKFPKEQVLYGLTGSAQTAS